MFSLTNTYVLTDSLALGGKLSIPLFAESMM